MNVQKNIISSEQTGIVLFDGISGSGKGERLKTLAEYIRNEFQKEVMIFAEPFYLRDEILIQRKKTPRNPRRELELLIEDRKIGLEYYKRFIGSKNHIILGDRSFISTLVYQSLDGIPIDEIKKLNSFYPTPDIAFILECDPQIAISRIHSRHIALGVEISSNETLEKIKTLREKYLEIASTLPYAHIINTNGREEAIDLVLKSYINNYFGKPMQKAIFLDKDGTIVDHSMYKEMGPRENIPTDKIYNESYPALLDAQNKGYKLFIISSQPWVARGLMTHDDVEDGFKSVVSKYVERGIVIDDYEYCIHDREFNCPDKKPSTRLFENIVTKYNIDTTKSFMVGDMQDDIIAGKNIGLKTIRIGKIKPGEVTADYEINSIADMSKYV
ncbi:MAG: HAD-IIIA family hydrolase [Candidatus Woesearchaeota archaeon]